jgi:hypothetical protein
MHIKAFKVWNPSVETEDEAMTLYTTSLAFAAEDYAAEVGFLGEYTLMVREEGGVCHEVSLFARQTVEYNIISRKL